MQEETFKTTQKMIYELAKLPNTSISDFASVTFASFDSFTLNFTVSDVQQCLNQTDQLCLSIRYAYNMFVNHTQLSMWVLYSPSFDPLSNLGISWLKDARSIVANISRDSQV